MKTNVPGHTSLTLVVKGCKGIVGILDRSPHPLIMTHQGTTLKFWISAVSLLPRLSRWRIPTFLKAATPVLTQAIRIRSQNREPQVVDSLGNLFVIVRAFSSVDFVNCQLWTLDSHYRFYHRPTNALTSSWLDSRTSFFLKKGAVLILHSNILWLLSNTRDIRSWSFIALPCVLAKWLTLYCEFVCS